jgi:hypothetical protein
MSVFKFLLTSVCLRNQVDGFQFARPTLHLETRTRLHSITYGRGADIWPPTNEDAVHLRDTFPNGQVPYSAIVTIAQHDMEAVHEGVEEAINGTMTLHDAPKRSKRKFVSRSIRRILRRAATKEELDSEEEIVGVDRTPIIVALTLLMQGLVRPMDGMVVVCITFYLTFLGMIARSPREYSDAPILPAMPPQGHVPAMVSNPLGIGILHSRLYDAWLKLGVIIGLVGPMLLLTHYVLFENNVMAARVCSRPTFLLCCQAISESFSRKVMVRIHKRHCIAAVLWHLLSHFYLLIQRRLFLCAFSSRCSTIQQDWDTFGTGHRNQCHWV